MAAKKMTNYELRQNLCDQMTKKLVSALKEGLVEDNWQAPWAKVGFSMPTNAQTKKAYRGVNTLMLWLEAMERGYSHHLWASFAQWKKLGAKVRRGEKAHTFVVFWKIFKVEETNEKTGEIEEKTIPYLQYTKVFNVDQVEGFEMPATETIENDFDVQEHVEEVINNTGADINHGGDSAYYIPSKDKIQLPMKEQFHTSSDYYATTLHELAHWTSHEDRCNRDLMSARFGNEAYAFEELVAELSSAFTCNIVGVKGAESRQSHAKYVKSWIKVLENDHGAIMKASKLAQDATDHILSYSEQE